MTTMTIRRRLAAWRLKLGSTRYFDLMDEANYRAMSLGCGQPTVADVHLYFLEMMEASNG